MVDPARDGRLREHLPATPALRLVRGNRFPQLQGGHDKADVVPALLGGGGAGTGPTVACGDSPNDFALLAAADLAVIVPGPRGPHPELVQRLPGALIASGCHGHGWAMAIEALLALDTAGPPA